MSASLAILTIGIVPMQEVLPLLTEYIDEDNISHHSLLGKLSREEVMAEYAPEAGEDTILTILIFAPAGPCFASQSGARPARCG